MSLPESNFDTQQKIFHASEMISAALRTPKVACNSLDEKPNCEARKKKNKYESL